MEKETQDDETQVAIEMTGQMEPKETTEMANKDQEEANNNYITDNTRERNNEKETTRKTDSLEKKLMHW